MDKAIEGGTGQEDLPRLYPGHQLLLVPYFGNHRIDKINAGRDAQPLRHGRIEQMGKVAESLNIVHPQRSLNRIFDAGLVAWLYHEGSNTRLQKISLKSERRPVFSRDEWLTIAEP